MASSSEKDADSSPGGIGSFVRNLLGEEQPLVSQWEVEVAGWEAGKPASKQTSDYSKEAKAESSTSKVYSTSLFGFNPR